MNSSPTLSESHDQATRAILVGGIVLNHLASCDSLDDFPDADMTEDGLVDCVLSKLESTSRHLLPNCFNQRHAFNRNSAGKG